MTIADGTRFNCLAFFAASQNLLFIYTTLKTLPITNYQSSQNSISATSGTINIELCKNYNLSITGNTVFNITASDSESDIFPEQTLIQVDYKSKSASISFQCSGSNITRYFNDNTPVFDKVGTYDIVIERYGKSNNLSNNDLTIGVIFTGEYSSGGTGDGGYGW